MTVISRHAAPHVSASDVAGAAEATTPAARFLALLFPAPRAFAVRAGDRTLLAAEGEPVFTLALPPAGQLRTLFHPPVELSLGEAYLRGEFDIEGDVCAAFQVIRQCRSAVQSPASVAALVRAWRALPRNGSATAAGPGYAPAALSGAAHSRRRDREAIRYHYDVGNDFYELFLDRRMVYSCGYFPTGTEELDAAQEAKLDLICRKLRLKPGERLLDVGCGWGGLLLHAAERYGVYGMGITLSEEQYRLARERVAAAGLTDRVRIEIRDYRDLDDGPFDKIASVGMFEHVGRARLPEYFAQLGRLVQPGGLILNHGIAERPSPRRRSPSPVGWITDRLLVGRRAFRERYIFPNGELVPVSEANLAAERAGLEVRDVENLREHYARTLRLWVRRLEERRVEAVQLAGEATYRLWRLYMAASAYHFEQAMIGVHQTLLARPAAGRVELPPSRGDLYA